VSGKVLDLGCGKNSPIQYCKKVRFSVGVDIDKKAILESKEKGIHNSYIIKDIKKGLNFKKRSFDCVLLLDVIEHLPKRNGFKLLDLAKQIAKKKIIVYTPNGFMKQLEGLEKSSIYQKHLSGWSYDEMKKLGFSKIYGINGWKYLNNIKFKIVKYFLQDLSSFLFIFIPKYSFQILCIKHIENSRYMKKKI
jgi:SAM-dependent methyltransferase